MQGTENPPFRFFWDTRYSTFSSPNTHITILIGRHFVISGDLGLQVRITFPQEGQIDSIHVAPNIYYDLNWASVYYLGVQLIIVQYPSDRSQGYIQGAPPKKKKKKKTELHTSGNVGIPWSSLMWPKDYLNNYVPYIFLQSTSIHPQKILQTKILEVISLVNHHPVNIIISKDKAMLQPMLSALSQWHDITTGISGWGIFS